MKVRLRNTDRTVEVAGPAAVRRVLYRLGEREMAACCVVQGLDRAPEQQPA